MLIVLDDLHWADVPSIRLLQVVVSELAGARLLVLGLYRGAEAYARAELASLLPAILRERTAGRIALGGLAAAEVERLTTRTLPRPARPPSRSHGQVVLVGQVADPCQQVRGGGGTGRVVRHGQHEDARVRAGHAGRA
jgi:predicted ATPase